MSLKVPHGATLILLNDLVTAILGGCTLRLYSNNHTPADTDTAADYTECTFPGYAGIALAGWSAAAINLSGKAEVDDSIKTFTAGTIIVPQNVYGIFVTDVSGNLVYAELNPGGVVSIAVSGQQYSYTPQVTLKSEF